MQVSDNQQGQPKDQLTYDYMLSRIRDDLAFTKLNHQAKAIGVKYRVLRLICNQPDYKPSIDVVNDIYRKLFWATSIDWQPKKEL